MTPVSGAREPLAEECESAELDGFEGDHMMASHPGDSRRLVAVWVQDGETTVGFARSGDGGRSWTATTVPGFTSCDGSGGPFGFVFDAWASVGGDGRTYVTAAVATPSPIPPDPEGGYGVVVVSSPDGGRSWDTPVTVARSIDLLPTDKPTVGADPVVPGRAWLTWTEVSVIGGTSITRIARTDDGGQTWSAPSLHLPASPTVAEFGQEIAVLPDGSLLRTFSRFSAQPLVVARLWLGGGTTIVAARSVDGGRTWSETVVDHVPDSVLRDPETGEDLALGMPHVVADLAADGSDVALAWAETTPEGRVRVARSADGGATWLTETVAAGPAPMFRAAVAVENGNVTTAYSDLAEDTLGDDELTTVVRLASRNRTGWESTTVGPGHDLRRARSTAATAIPGGDYWGLVLDRGTSVVGMALPAPHAMDGPSDVYAWRASTPHGGAGRARHRAKTAG